MISDKGDPLRSPLNPLFKGGIIGKAGIFKCGNHLIPNDELVHLEAYACVLPQDDSHWRDLVNYSILRVIQGYIIEDPEFSKMFAGWFGEQGVSPYPEAILQDYFQGILDSKERIPTTAF